MEPLQLGTLSPSFLEQRAPEAPQLLGILSPTPPRTPQSPLLWATHVPPPEQGLGGGGPSTPPHPPGSSRLLALP